MHGSVEFLRERKKKRQPTTTCVWFVLIWEAIQLVRNYSQCRDQIWINGIKAINGDNSLKLLRALVFGNLRINHPLHTLKFKRNLDKETREEKKEKKKKRPTKIQTLKDGVEKLPLHYYLEPTGGFAFRWL